MPSRFLLPALFALVASALAGDRPPNVVLFLVDDLGWRDLGCQGSDYYRTPNIDRLAAEGTRFTNAYAACAVCSPTRASILTGKYPARLLLTQWLPAGRWDPGKHPKREGRFLRQLPLEEVTLAEALKPVYATLHVGKWHLGGLPFSYPEQHGFDVNIAGSDHGAPGSYFFPYKGKWTVPTTGKPVLKQTLPDGEPGEYLTDRLVEESLALVREHADRPFFLYLPFYAVHTPLQAKKEKRARYEAIPEEERQGQPAYAAMVETVDDGVGKILGLLEELELDGLTHIVFTSDNGGYARATDNAPLRANKGSHYEGGIRVPLIFRGPKVRAGAVTDVPAITNDLYPTLLDLVGLPPRPEQTVDGISLAGLLEEGREPEPRSLFWHYPHYNQHPESAPVSIIRKGKWKLIQSLDSDLVELFDLEKDPGESTNRYLDHVELGFELLLELETWRADVGADPMKPNPLYQP